MFYILGAGLKVQKSVLQVPFQKEGQEMLGFLLNVEKKGRAWVPLPEVSKILNSAGFPASTSLSVFRFLIQPNKYYLA